MSFSKLWLPEICDCNLPTGQTPKYSLGSLVIKHDDLNKLNVEILNYSTSACTKENYL